MSGYVARHDVPGRTRDEGGNVWTLEWGILYRNGYEIKVWWENADEIWYASLTGIKVMDTCLGHGDTKEAALLCLACALAATCDAIEEDA